MVTGAEGVDSHHVYLQLAAGEIKGSSASDWVTNRIAMKCDNISIATNKQVMAHPIPGSGIITGESQAFSLDLGMSSKTISLSGVLTSQTITKQFGDYNIDWAKVSSGSVRSSAPTYVTDNKGRTAVEMTAQEVAQLIHSYVDSSFRQEHQNLNKLIILIPSFVSKYYTYHTSAMDSSRNTETAPLIPWSFAVRDTGKNSHKLDAQGSNLASSFPNPVSTSALIGKEGIGGFIRNFSTTLVGGSPFVEFSMEFEVAQISFK